ncbi:MAG: very short patch repair endonuclease [Pseudomonadota bacterium]|nr:very short patch repair endonuclease [Pseudomonadota bacterium]
MSRDRLTAAERSKNMSRVRNRDTAPELAVRRLLHRAGYRFRLHRRDLPGKPDIVLPRWRLAIFVHGCFWHGHEGCRRAALPSARQEFWSSKIGRNRARDATASAALQALGYKVLTLWQCELKDPEEVLARTRRITGSGE